MSNYVNRPAAPRMPWGTCMPRLPAPSVVYQQQHAQQQHAQQLSPEQQLAQQLAELQQLTQQHYQPPTSMYSNFPSTSILTACMNNLSVPLMIATNEQHYPSVPTGDSYVSHHNGFKKSLVIAPPSSEYIPESDNNNLPISTNNKPSPIVKCEHCPIPANCRCLECMKFFCPRCILHHTRSNPQQSHTVIGFESAAAIKPLEPRSNTSSTSDLNCVSKSPSPKIQEPPQCKTHNEAFRSFCIHCFVDVCQECTLWQHADHDVIAIDECLSYSRRVLKNFLRTTDIGIRSVKSNIDKATKMPAIIERHNIDTINKIKRAMKRMRTAVDERETQLVEMVGKMREAKLAETETKTRHLRRILACLAKITNKINKTLDRSDRMVAFKSGREVEEEMANLLNYFNQNEIFEVKIEFQHVNDFTLKDLMRAHGKLNFCTIEPNQVVPAHLYRNYYNIAMLTTGPSSPCKSFQCIPGSLLPVVMQKPENCQQPKLSFAFSGKEHGQLSRPWGLCVDKKGNFLVADRRNNRIQIFTPDGHFKLTFGEKGKGDGEFELPAGICINNQNEIIVVDKDNHRIQVFEETGQFIFKFGTLGSMPGQFSYPWDVDVNDMGDMIVTDSRNHRLQMFDSRGRLIRLLNLDNFHYFKTIKGVTSPRGCCFTPNGNIAVTDFENSRILIIDRYVTAIIQTRGYEGCDDNSFSRPSGIVCDDAGNIIVADGKNQRVQAFSPFFEFKWSVNVPILSDKDRPCDVALTPDGRLAVLMENLPNANGIERIAGFFNVYIY